MTSTTTTTTAPKAILLEVAGQKFPVLRTAKSDANDPSVFYTFRDVYDKTGRYGLEIDPTTFDDPQEPENLPTGIVLDGVKVYLDRTLTSDVKYKNVVVGLKDDGRPLWQSIPEEIPEEQRRPMTASKTYQYLPSLAGTDDEDDKGLRHVQAQVSLTTDNLWQIKVVVNRQGLGASPAAVKAAKTAKAKDRLANFAAILEAMGVEEPDADADE